MRGPCRPGRRRNGPPFNLHLLRTRLYIDATDQFRYFIPLPTPLSEEILFMPYWRIRALAYTFEQLAMTNRYIDTNLSGNLELTHEKMGIVMEKNALRYDSSM